MFFLSPSYPPGVSKGTRRFINGDMPYIYIYIYIFISEVLYVLNLRCTCQRNLYDNRLNSPWPAIVINRCGVAAGYMKRVAGGAPLASVLQFYSRCLWVGWSSWLLCTIETWQEDHDQQNMDPGIILSYLALFPGSCCDTISNNWLIEY